MLVFIARFVLLLVVVIAFCCLVVQKGMAMLAMVPFCSWWVSTFA